LINDIFFVVDKIVDDMFVILSVFHKDKC